MINCILETSNGYTGSNLAQLKPETVQYLLQIIEEKGISCSVQITVVFNKKEDMQTIQTCLSEDNIS